MEMGEKSMFDASDALQPILEPMRRQRDAIRVVMGPLSRKTRRQQEAVRGLGQLLIEFAERAGQAQLRVMPYLSDRGWYITYRFPVNLFIHLDSLRQAGNHAEVDAAMSELARQNLGDVESALRRRFPDRERLFADAFEAHRLGKYTLSIPVFLSQADGVGCEVLGIPRHFFKAKNRSAALQQKLKAFVVFGVPFVVNGVEKEMLDPLESESSLTAATEERDDRQSTEPWFCPLNRHGVLHGVDTDYASEANSLRCVLLLQYLLDVDQILHRDIPAEVASWNEMWEGTLSDGPEGITT
jgi:hypothetical protein